MDHASARKHEENLRDMHREASETRRLLTRVDAQLGRLERGAQAGGANYQHQFTQLTTTLERLAQAQQQIETSLHEAVADGRQWQRELAVAYARDLPRQHVPIAQHARWATAKTKSVTAEAIVNNVAPTLTTMTEAAAAAASASAPGAGTATATSAGTSTPARQ